MNFLRNRGQLDGMTDEEIDRLYNQYMMSPRHFTYRSEVFLEKVIPAKTIATAEWVRLKCRFGCDGFGQSLTCPPYSK
jgi:hypothetical protein